MIMANKYLKIRANYKRSSDHLLQQGSATLVNVFFADIEYADQCELFDEENGFEKLDELVDHEIEKHTELATKIKENVAAWKKQREHYLRSKRLS